MSDVRAELLPPQAASVAETLLNSCRLAGGIVGRDVAELLPPHGGIESRDVAELLPPRGGNGAETLLNYCRLRAEGSRDVAELLPPQGGRQQRRC